CGVVDMVLSRGFGGSGAPQSAGRRGATANRARRHRFIRGVRPVLWIVARHFAWIRAKLHAGRPIVKRRWPPPAPRSHGSVEQGRRREGRGGACESLLGSRRLRAGVCQILLPPSVSLPGWRPCPVWLSYCPAGSVSSLPRPTPRLATPGSAGSPPRRPPCSSGSPAEPPPTSSHSAPPTPAAGSPSPTAATARAPPAAADNT